MDAPIAEAAARPASLSASRLLTNFYPTYGPANDQVDRITPVRRAVFQRVIPRYRLSTSETRDQGLGPQFLDAGISALRPSSAESREAPARASLYTQTPRGRARAPLPDYVGRRVDIYV